ncbi:MAG: hypothetical protein JRD04_09665 [Deltaproteobacteria bacterium]|nr:hypothetical protein [Deltaproteobacteria bacterium]
MYFEESGKTHTEETLKRAFERAVALGLNEVVVASTTGDTALKAAEIFEKFTITAVSYHCGFRKPFESVMDPGVRNDLLAKGIHVISATHALSGVERAVAKKHGGVYPALLIADTLRLFGQGTKVAVEVAIMAADSGALTGKDIVSIGGSGRGSDTALILKPANQSEMFELRIREVVCKPRNF